MNRLPTKYILLGICLLLLAGFTIAQPERRKLDVNVVTGDEVRFQNIMRRAEYLMSLQDYHSATEILQVLYDENPVHPEVNSLLQKCFEESKDYLRLLDHIRSRMTREKASFYLHFTAARAHMLNNDLDSALWYFVAAADLSDGNKGKLQAIAESLYRRGYYDEQGKLIDTLRVIYHDSTLLAEHYGDAMAAQQDFRTATVAYLAAMEQDTTKIKDIESKIISMIQYPESVDTVMAVLTERTELQQKNDRVFNMYGMILMEQNQFDLAYDFYIERDSMFEANGSYLIFFIREAEQRQRPDMVVRAADYILDHKDVLGTALQALWYRAAALTLMNRHEDALADYREFIKKHPRAGNQAEAKVMMGHIYKEYLDQPETARMQYYDAINLMTHSRYAADARFALAELFVNGQQFDSALSQLNQARQIQLSDELTEVADFQTAQIYLFQRRYDEAIEQFKRIISNYPRGFYVNDAIQYALMVSETMESAEDHLDLFSAAEYYREINRRDSLKYYLTKICRIGIPSLAPVSYLRLAELYYQQGNLDEAMTAVDSLAAGYQESYYYPYGVKLKADILWKTEDTRDKARDLYRGLLEKYGKYPFAAEIREMLRRERGVDQI